MTSEAIEPSADRVHLPARVVPVPAHITAAAPSLGISAAQMAQQIAVQESTRAARASTFARVAKAIDAIV